MSLTQTIQRHDHTWLNACSVVLVLVGLWLGACTSGDNAGTAGTATPQTQSEVVIGLTDAEGDFLSYTVRVLSLTLTHSNGAVVEALPVSLTVDFAQLTEVTEFLTAATVPSGIYTSASLVLDYSNAQIMVEDASGNALSVTAVDTTGAPISQLEVAVQFSNTDTFRIAPGIPAYVTLDFDVPASHNVDLALATVTVDPVLLADTLLEESRNHRLRGLLDTVETDNDMLVARIRPFHRLTGDFGSVRVHVLDTTTYEIDGVALVGDIGLQALSELPLTSAVAILGQWNGQAQQFEALEVYAGTSVPVGDNDVATGHIIARTGDVLSLKGVTIIRADSSVVFHDIVTVTIASTTHVTKQGSVGDTFDTDDVSVAQKVDVIGTLTNTTPGSLAMDATAGQVRLRYTNVSGHVVQVTPLVLDVQHIDGRAIHMFNFTGTGASVDADPEHYDIDTSTLSLAAVAVNEAVKVRGFATRFGTAPPDFTAHTIVTVQQLTAHLLVRWQDQGNPTPFSSQSNSALVVDLTVANLGRSHHVVRGRVATDLVLLGAHSSIEPDADNNGPYAIAQSGTVQIFADFADFATTLDTQLDGITALKHLSGTGHFDDSTNTFQADRLAVLLQ